MTEHEAMDCSEEEKDEQDEEPWVNGLVTGLTGRQIRVNGVVDLRGVPAEEVAATESVRINGVVVLDEANRSSLSGVTTQINGSTIVADPDLRLVVEMDMEFSKAAVEAMPAGQKLMLVGNIFFKPDVPPDLIAEKFDRLHLVGIVIACEGVYGALMGKMEKTGITITLPQDVGEVVRSMGASEWTEEYLTRLSDGTTYVNIGVTEVPADVPVKLVERKIAAYHNVGATQAPGPIVALLKSRCRTDMGSFSTQGEDEGEHD